MTAPIYRDDIIRAVMGERACDAKVADLARVDLYATLLAEGEEAKKILRANGYGQAGTSIVEVAKAVPANAGRVLANLFRGR
jgi:hypothetical protein